MADPVALLIEHLRGDFAYDDPGPELAADLLESQAARIAELEAALRKAEPYIYPIGDGMDVLDKVRRALASAEQRG